MDFYEAEKEKYFFLPSNASFSKCSACKNCPRVFACEYTKKWMVLHEHIGIHGADGDWYKVTEVRTKVTAQEFHEIEEYYSQEKYTYKEKILLEYAGHNYGIPGYKNESLECKFCNDCQNRDTCVARCEEEDRTIYLRVDGVVRKLLQKEYEKTCIKKTQANHD